MNAIVKETHGVEGTVFRTDVAEPKPGPGQLKVKVMAASICGSDIHALFNGLMADRYRCPVIIGHEGAGEVVEVGEGVTSFKVGDRVTAETTLKACGTCEYCRKGQTNLCGNRSALGSSVDGYFAQYCIVAEKHAHKLADHLSYDVGALAEPFACTVHATCILTNPLPGDVVLVAGPGPIGQMVAAIAKMSGCVVVLSGITADADRFRFAQENWGIEHCVDSTKTNLKEYIANLTDGRGADYVYECSGSVPGILSGFDCCKKKGTFVAVGMNMGQIPLDYYNIVYTKEITILGDKSTSTITWDRAMRILNNKCIDLSPMVSKTIPLSKWMDGYLDFKAGKCMKVVMHPWDEE